MSRILVIDDDHAICDVLRKTFEREGHSVMVAHDGAAGVDLFRQHSADVVITDIIMPEREGIETTMEIKSIDPNARIIAISGGGRIGATDFLAMARKLGADHAFTKPFDRRSVVAAVHDLIAVQATGGAAAAM